MCMSFIYQNKPKTKKITTVQEHCKTEAIKLQYDSFFISLDHVLTSWEVIILSILGINFFIHLPSYMLLIALVFQNWALFSSYTMIEITLSSTCITSMQTVLRRRLFSCSVLLFYFNETKIYQTKEVKYKAKHK